MIPATFEQNKWATEFRHLLQQELIERTARNPKYSLRAFAKQLGVTPPVLSHLIAGRRPFTGLMIQKLGLALGLTPDEIENYVQTLSKEGRTHLGATAGPFATLTQDVFCMIAHWYHDAILELTHIPTFRSEPRWIAKALGVSVNEVNAAVERLIRLELLNIEASGAWVDISKDNTTQLHPDFTSAALRKYQEKILELSLESLRNVPKPLRDHSSSMTAIDVADLDEVKMRIQKFRKELSDFLQRKGTKPNQVYQLAISYFPLTNLESNIDLEKGEIK